MLFSNDPYFITDKDTGQVKTNIESNIPRKITRAASGSRGQIVEVELLEKDSAIDDWASGDIDVPDGGKVSGFGEYKSRFGGMLEEESLYPIDYMSRSTELSPVEEKRILASKDASRERLARIYRDPVTRVPENFAAVDRLPESDKFYGNDKPEAETTTTMNRAKDVDRGVERVDYKPSRSVPIKIVRK